MTWSNPSSSFSHRHLSAPPAIPTTLLNVHTQHGARHQHHCAPRAVRAGRTGKNNQGTLPAIRSSRARGRVPCRLTACSPRHAWQSGQPPIQWRPQRLCPKQPRKRYQRDREQLVGHTGRSGGWGGLWADKECTSRTRNQHRVSDLGGAHGQQPKVRGQTRHAQGTQKPVCTVVRRRQPYRARVLQQARMAPHSMRHSAHGIRCAMATATATTTRWGCHQAWTPDVQLRLHTGDVWDTGDALG
jgi:hypothetical protein